MGLVAADAFRVAWGNGRMGVEVVNVRRGKTRKNGRSGLNIVNSGSQNC